MEILTKFLIFAVVFAFPNAYGSSSSSEEEVPEYECGNKFYKYYMDKEPAEYGLYAGKTTTGKDAYVGLGSWQQMTLNTGPLTLNPPGILLSNNGGVGDFVNTTGAVWYLYRRRSHWYEWVNTTDASTQVKYAVDFGSGSIGSPHYFGRIKKNNTVFIGIVSLYLGKMYYVNEYNKLASADNGFKVLTCRAWNYEKPITPPQVPRNPNAPPNVDIGCIHNWQPYNNDNAPAKNGISAGDFDCNNTAYVGKGNPNGPWRPGRIQTVGASGLYTVQKGAEFYVQNGSYYLVDNPNYTYKWKQFDGKLPDNAVNVRNNVGNLYFAVTRIKTDGRVRIGKFMGLEAEFPTLDGTSTKFYNDYEVLTCDPHPKYQCGQKWKKYNNDNAPSTDGFKAGTTYTNVDAYIGRGTAACVNGCDYKVGRIQISPSSAAGLYYLDELLYTEIFDNTTAEYLVKNVNDTYVWKASGNGVKVSNAIELHPDGHQPSYIGMTNIDHSTYIGKVVPGVGMYYIDADGKGHVASSYDVLTCFSSDPSNGVPNQSLFEDWHVVDKCSARQRWAEDVKKCVCKDEFKDVFAAKNSQWNEETCSYVN
ncbi:hypothetical protein PVAND_016081 [Polypedilum vanderplanki]|uniref:Uncharacterized protein n=1 Tax=Polypedilum vanderplanki TaxID=319348 RepID=A0A9J6BE25_POLVA|nr:hypothetical protein PVAND_016081 [Polypedilum vanderplanki]